MKKEKNKNEKEHEDLETKDLIIKGNKKKNIFQKFINMIKNKLLTNTIATILLVIVIIDLYILANIILNKVILKEFDFTENKVYSLSEETKSKIKNIENEVTITLINYSDVDAVYKIVEKYIILNENITMEKIDDLASRKDLMEKYSLAATSRLIIISSGEDETTLSEYDLYKYDYSTNENIDATEESFTNAIIEVSTKDKPKIYFMNNHTQYDIETNFYIIQDFIKNDGNEIKTVDILITGSVPEDCDTLVITTLSEDITEFEKDKLLEYINKGGEILLLCGPNLTGKSFKNFQEVLNQYGITLEEGIIYEGDNTKMLQGYYKDFIVEKVEYSSITKNIDMNFNVCLLGAASIKLDKDKAEELKVEYEELIYTSNKAYLVNDLSKQIIGRIDEESESKGFIVGALVNKEIDDKEKSKLIIIANELFASDMIIPLGEAQQYLLNLYNNSDVVLNSIAYLNEREDIITIRKDYDSVTTYTATAMQYNIIMVIIFTLPIIIIIGGIIVWQVRRRKK